MCRGKGIVLWPLTLVLHIFCSIISLTILASKWYVIWQNCDFLDKCKQFDPIL